jgi:hypothetical protein
MNRLLISIFSSFVLSACGGGGGGTGAIADVPGIQAPSAVTAVSAN